jgi:hypothetical protein
MLGLLLLQEKIDVNGPNTHPVYQYLKGACSNCSGDVRWNFAGESHMGWTLPSALCSHHSRSSTPA